jgi:hypothetical protein
VARFGRCRRLQWCCCWWAPALAQRYDGEAKKNLGLVSRRGAGGWGEGLLGSGDGHAVFSRGDSLHRFDPGNSTGSSTLTADAERQLSLLRAAWSLPGAGDGPGHGCDVHEARPGRELGGGAELDRHRVARRGVRWTTNDYTILDAALTAASAGHKFVKIPDGKTCAYGTQLTVANASNWGIIGGPGSKLKYTGAGDAAIYIDGTGTTNGAASIVIRDVALDAPSGSHCLHLVKVTRSEVHERRLPRRECRGLRPRLRCQQQPQQPHRLFEQRSLQSHADGRLC